MRLGVCTSLENIELVEKAGYDYIEPAVCTIANFTNQEYSLARKRVNESSIKAEVFNQFMPSQIKVVGEEVDNKKVKDYVMGAVDRISNLGAEMLVFGSGGARYVPEGFPKLTALRQLEDFLNIVSEIIKPYGIVLVIEPLPLRSCNIINNVLEGLELTKKVNRLNIRLLADYFHMLYHNEDINNIIKAGEYIRHIHVNNANGGLYPKYTDNIDYVSLFEPLKKINYQGRISIEASTDNLQKDMAESMNLWKIIF